MHNPLHVRSTRLSVSCKALAPFSLAALLASQALCAQQLLSDASTAPRLTPYSSSIVLPLPEAPRAQTAAQTQQEHEDGQQKRILGVLPNFRSVNADVHLPPQTVKDKFVTATEDSFDYSSIFVPLAVAGYDYGRNSTPEFGTGGVAYGRYLWHAAVDQTSENFFVEAIVPSLTHEDNRYYTLGHGGFVKQAGYALTRVIITRSDSGKNVFNASEVIGAGASAGLSSVYYPVRERSFGNTADQWGLNVGIDALSFVVKEFWPDINHALFHGAPPAQQVQHP